MVKLAKADKAFYVLNTLFLALIFLLIAYPLIYILSASFSSPHAVISGKVWLLPVDFSLEGYKAVFKNSQIWRGYLNSIFYMALGTCINLVLTIMAAYPLSRRDWPGRGIFMGILTFTMIFSGGMIPTYLLIKNLGMIDTIWAMVLPGAISVYNVIVTRTYFQNTIGDELREAAELDGCSDIRFILRVVLPLSGAILAVMTLFYGTAHWSAYFNALLYLNSQKLYPLQIILRNILILNQVDAEMITDVDELMLREGLKDLLKYSLIIVSSAPMLILYPFVQKYFVKGVMIGSVKG